MITEIVKLEGMQLCNSCGRKIPKNSKAINIKNSGIYFCDRSCLIKGIKEVKEYKESEELNNIANSVFESQLGQGF